jgi:hypothetical protein
MAGDKISRQEFLARSIARAEDDHKNHKEEHKGHK